MKFDFEYQCDKEWDEMQGGDRRRYCDSCDKHVHHISGMTKERALKFLEERNWQVCVDFFADPDGNAQFRERESRLAMQADGLKQVVAAALTVLPLAIAAAFIDFDRAEPAETAIVADEPPTPPIDLSGPSPTLVTLVDTPQLELPTTDQTPVVTEIREPDIVTEIPEPDVELFEDPRLRLRGRVRPLRPADDTRL